jgi:hypothetical protein
MRQIYDMFLGSATPAQVLAAAGTRPQGQFYANLYVGLYHEANGNAAAARRHLTAAADGRFAEAGGYMHTVADVHMKRLGPARGISP